MPPSTQGTYLVIIAMGLIAANDALGKYLTQYLPVLQVLWVRSWVFFALALTLIGYRGQWQAVRSQRLFLQTLRSVLLVVEISVFMYAFRALPLAEVTTVVAASPLVVTFLAVLVLGERVGWRRWSAVALGFVGVLFVTRPGGDRFGWVMLLPLCGVLLWGSYQILSRYVSRWDTPETSLLYSALAAVIGLSFIAPWQWAPLDAYSWALLILLGLLNGGGHFALIKALTVSEASVIQPFSYTMIAWAVLFGWWGFGHLPDWWTLIGMALIVVSGLYAFYRERVVQSRGRVLAQ